MMTTFRISDHTRLGHWILDGDPEHSNLLRFALTEENFTDTTVLLCVAMTTPWNIMDQLRNWATILQDHIDKLSLSAEKTKKLQNESKSEYRMAFKKRMNRNLLYFLCRYTPTAIIC